jgi:excisionase family DNA binding protein
MNDASALPDGDRLMRIKEVANVMRMSDKTVRRMIDAGQLQSRKIRGIRLIRWTELQRVLQGTA